MRIYIFYTFRGPCFIQGAILLFSRLTPKTQYSVFVRAKGMQNQPSARLPKETKFGSFSDPLLVTTKDNGIGITLV